MKITRIETTIIPNTEHGQKYADEYCGKLKVQGAFRNRVNTITDEIIVDAKYTLTVREPADYRCKCGSCKWLNEKDKSSVGYSCDNPDKKWMYDLARYKVKSTKACKMYDKRTHTTIDNPMEDDLK